MCEHGFLKNYLLKIPSRFSEKRECVTNITLFISSLLLSDSEKCQMENKECKESKQALPIKLL